MFSCGFFSKFFIKKSSNSSQTSLFISSIISFFSEEKRLPDKIVSFKIFLSRFFISFR